MFASKGYRRPLWILYFVMAGIFIFAATVPGTAGARERIRKVLIIGLDGARFDAVEKANTPNIDRLIADGFAMKARIQGDRYHASDTVSGAGWSSILTGVWADKHGVDDNKFSAPHFDRYPHLFARVKAANPQAHTVSLVSWAPIDQYIVSHADISLVVSEPKTATDSPAAIAARQAAMDRAMTVVTAGLLRTDDPSVLFTYLHQADGVGHGVGYGPSVPEYMKAIETIDADIGIMLDAVKSRKSYASEDWLILIVTDHGGAGQGHNNGHADPLVASSFIIVSGGDVKPVKRGASADIVDVVPTVLSHLGIAIDPIWGLDGRSLVAGTRSPQ